MAEAYTGDRMWQFPPWYFYTKQVTLSQSEIKTIGFWKAGGAFEAVASLTQFLASGEWMHSVLYRIVCASATDEPYLLPLL
jgi:leucyl aminopeptidase